METGKEKIKRFISGHFSFNDYLTVSSLFREKESFAELKNFMEEDWDETGNNGNDQERFSRILDRLHHRMNLGRGQSFTHLFSKVASVLLLPCLVTIAVLYFARDKFPQIINKRKLKTLSGEA